jgi:O-antigen/teichoic acid export membrane protein
MAGGMKRLAKETAVYGLSSIVGRFLNWMLVPMYTRVLAGTGDYGIVTNLYGWTALLLVLLTYGMETGFFRFINKKEEQEPMRVYASVLYCLLGSSALFSVAVFALLPSISAGLGYGDHPEYIGMMAGIVAVDAFCCIPWEFVQRLESMGGAFIEWPKANIDFDIELYKLCCQRMVLEAGVDLYMHSAMIGCKMGCLLTYQNNTLCL